MTVSRSVLVRLRAEMAQFKKEWTEGTNAVKDTRAALGDAAKQSKQTEGSIRDLDSMVARTSARLTKYRAEWDLVGSSLIKSGAIAVGAGALMAKAAIDWESAWTGVLKTVNGTPEELAAVESGIRDLAKTMPTSHKEIAATAEAAGQLGVATEDIVGFTRVMVMMGDTTNLSADEAATSIAQLMNVMQTAPGDVDRLGAAIVALGNEGASTERDIVQMAQRIAGAAEIVGLSEANVLSIANAVSSSGIEVEAGGTAISTVLIDIAKAVDTGSPKLAKFADVAGQSADQFAAKWKADPASALADFTEGLGRMSAEGDNVFGTLDALSLSDVRVTRALLNMANAGDLLRDSISTGNEAWSENEALVDEAAKRYDTTAAQAEIAWNNIKDNAIDAGQGVLPVISALSDVVVTLGSAFGALPGPIKGSVGVLALFGGGTLLAVGGLMKAIGAIQDFRGAISTMELSSSRGVRAVGKLSKAAGIAAAVLGALKIAAEFRDLDVASVEKFASALLDVRQDGGAALESIAESSHEWIGLQDRIGGVAAAILEVESNSKGANKHVQTVLGKIGLGDEKGAKTLEAIDGALTSLVQSGATEEAADQFDYLAERAEVVGVSSERLLELLPTYSDALSSLDNEQKLAANSADNLAESSSALDRRLAELGGGEDAIEMLNQMSAASQDAALSFVDFTKDADEGLQQWMSSLEEQTAAMEAWADNMIKATSRGVDRGVIAKFEEMGPEGAKLLAELVDGSQAEIDRLNDVFGDGINTAYSYADALNGIPESVLTEFATPGADGAIQTAIEVADKYNLAPDQVRTILEALDYASPDIDEVLDGLGQVEDNTVTAKVKAETEQAKQAIDAIRIALNSINPFKTIRIHTIATTEGSIPGGGGRQLRADGGPITGVGGPKQDNILIAGSVGEHMWTAKEVENAGGHGAVYAMRAMARAGKRPRYADGGAIEDAWNQSFRSAAAAFGAPVASVAADAGPNVVTVGLGGQSFELTITNWSTGQGYITAVADSRANARVAQSARTKGAANRRGKH